MEKRKISSYYVYKRDAGKVSRLSLVGNVGTCEQLERARRYDVPLYLCERPKNYKRVYNGLMSVSIGSNNLSTIFKARDERLGRGFGDNGAAAFVFAVGSRTLEMFIFDGAANDKRAIYDAARDGSYHEEIEALRAEIVSEFGRVW